MGCLIESRALSYVYCRSDIESFRFHLSIPYCIKLFTEILPTLYCLNTGVCGVSGFRRSCSLWNRSVLGDDPRHVAGDAFGLVMWGRADAHPDLQFTMHYRFIHAMIPLCGDMVLNSLWLVPWVLVWVRYKKY
jgi:hypothetical protein